MEMSYNIQNNSNIPTDPYPDLFIQDISDPKKQLASFGTLKVGFFDRKVKKSVLKDKVQEDRDVFGKVVNTYTIQVIVGTTEEKCLYIYVAKSDQRDAVLQRKARDGEISKYLDAYKRYIEYKKYLVSIKQKDSIDSQREQENQVLKEELAKLKKDLKKEKKKDEIVMESK